MSNRLGATAKRCLRQREKSDEDENPHWRPIVVSVSRREWAAGEKAIMVRAFSSRNYFRKSPRVTPTIV